MPAPWAYFDTSVLVKRYVREKGSGPARVLLGRYRFLSSAVAPLEVISSAKNGSEEAASGRARFETM